MPSVPAPIILHPAKKRQKLKVLRNKKCINYLVEEKPLRKIVSWDFPNLLILAFFGVIQTLWDVPPNFWLGVTSIYIWALSRGVFVFGSKLVLKINYTTKRTWQIDSYKTWSNVRWRVRKKKTYFRKRFFPHQPLSPHLSFYVGGGE